MGCESLTWSCFSSKPSQYSPGTGDTASVPARRNRGASHSPGHGRAHGRQSRLGEPAHRDGACPALIPKGSMAGWRCRAVATLPLRWWIRALPGGLGVMFFLGHERVSGASSKLHDLKARQVPLPQTHLSHVSWSSGCSVTILACSKLSSHAIPAGGCGGAVGALQPPLLSKQGG